MTDQLVDLLVATGVWPEDEARAAAPRLAHAARAGRHGTVEARDRHIARGEKLCHTCAPLGVPADQVPHGTPHGARWHRRHGQVPCGPCRRAWAAYIDRWRKDRNDDHERTTDG